MQYSQRALEVQFKLSFETGSMEMKSTGSVKVQCMIMGDMDCGVVSKQNKGPHTRNSFRLRSKMGNISEEI